MLSEAVEDYLKAIYGIEAKLGSAKTGDVAARLGVTPASATGMLKKLARMDYVVRRPYGGVTLTAEGKELASRLVRKHRLIERYLVEVLHMPWDKVHAEAEILEHAISDEVEKRIDSFLNHPQKCPHGSPIPSPTGDLSTVAKHPLADLSQGESGIVEEVDDHDPDMLAHLGSLGLYPGCRVELLEKEPFGGSFTILTGLGKSSMSPQLAEIVYVARERQNVRKEKE
jgi:DtxR family Mn-dependent transcriptional regulator